MKAAKSCTIIHLSANPARVGVSNHKGQKMKDKWRQKQQRKIMFWVVLVALLLAVAMEALIALRNYLRLH
jgi:hypothetical protein